jgi:DNA primase
MNDDSMYWDFAEKYLDLERNAHGVNVKAVCLFHQDHSPSMSFNVNTGLYYCFSCGAKGNIITLARRLGLDVKTNGYIADLDDPEKELKAVMASLDAIGVTVTEQTYPNDWLDKFKRVHTPYWETKRRLTQQTQMAWELGFDQFPNHGIIPIRNEPGEVIGVIRRQLEPDAQPKYLNPKNFQKKMALFGSWMLNTVPIERDVPCTGISHAVLCEGPLDAIKLWQAGYNGLAVLGSGLTREQVKLLHRLGIEDVTLFFDNDAAGFKMSMSAMGLLSRQFDLYGADYGYLGKTDPGSMTTSQIRSCIEYRVHLNGV